MRCYGHAGKLISQAIHSYSDEVRSAVFPADAESYHLSREAQHALSEAEPAPAVRQK